MRNYDIMMIYNPVDDTLTQTTDFDETIKLCYDDTVISSSVRGDRIHKLNNASKYIKKEILEKMKEENDYRIGIDIQKEDPFDPNSKYTSEVTVFRPVERVVPEHTIREWEEIK